MSTNYSYKFADIDEIERLAELYKNVFNINISTPQLMWLYNENPLLNGNCYNYIAIDKSKNIIGHNAYRPTNYILNNNIIKGAYSLGSMTIKGVSPIVFPRILKELENRLRIDGFDILIGFPNPNSFPFFINYFEFKQNYFELLSGRIDDISYSNKEININNLFYDSYYNELGENYIDWRITKNVFHKYEFYENEYLKIIYKLYNNYELDIISLIFKSTSFGLIMLKEFISCITNVNRINIYSTSSTFSNYLKKSGFINMYVKNKFVVKHLKNKSMNKNYNYFFQMIDSDVF